MKELSVNILTLMVNGKPLSVSIFEQLPAHETLPLSEGDKPLGIVKHKMKDEAEEWIDDWRGFWVLYLDSKRQLCRSSLGVGTKSYHTIRRAIQKLQNERDLCLRKAETPAGMDLPYDRWPLEAQEWKSLADDITALIKNEIHLWQLISTEHAEQRKLRLQYRDTLPQIFLVD